MAKDKHRAQYPVGLYKLNADTPEQWLATVTVEDYDYLDEHDYVVEAQWQTKTGAFLYIRRQSESQMKERGYRINPFVSPDDPQAPTAVLRRAIYIERKSIWPEGPVTDEED